MNKKLLPALIALSMAASAQAEDVDVYGKMNLTLQNADEGDTSVFEVKSNASRLGFKGTAETDSNFTVVYQYELGINPDDTTTWTQRNSFLGVKGDFGLVRAGLFDTAFKSSQGKVDVFGDLEGDIASAITVNDNRVANTVAYTTPNMSGFSGTVQYVASEEDGVDGGFSSAASYKADALYLAVAYDNGIEAVDSSAVRLTGTYQLGNVQLGALYETFEPAEGDSVSGGLVSAKIAVNKWDIKAQYGASDIVNEAATTVSVGADYNFTKKFQFISYITSEESDEGMDDTYIGAGAILKF